VRWPADGKNLFALRALWLRGRLSRRLAGYGLHVAASITRGVDPVPMSSENISLTAVKKRLRCSPASVS
jgi:hypothetical protein